MKDEKILIIGAGLCGSLLALRLAQRGYKVAIKEMRPDLRKTEISAGKSINLALSDRGIKALKLAGIQDKAAALCIPMYGRMIHSKQSETFQSNYSGRENEYINSISRGGLNALLLDEAEKNENVTLSFNQKCTNVDIENSVAYFEHSETKETSEYQANIIFGTDGAGSSLRKSYEKNEAFAFQNSVEYLSHGYKELSIPAAENGGFQIEKDALHIWPRESFMLIAIANLEGSFTVTLFLSHEEGTYNFRNLQTPEKITKFFQEEFPDALQIMPNLVEEFLNNPTGKLGTVKCSPWSFQDNTLLLGDAAHAVVPFYGQGMNCSFEDVTELDVLIEKHQGNWETIFKEYESRKIDSNAIADLAIDNFYEMRDHVVNPLFMQKRKIEMKLETEFPTAYFSKYSLVTFNENIPYSEAMRLGRLQDQVIIQLLENIEINEDMNAEELLTIIQEAVQKLK